MKRHLAVASLLCAAVSPALAADLDQLQQLGQGEFRAISKDLGAALSYKPLTPTEPLGITGFDVGVSLTATQIKNSSLLDRASSGDFPSYLPVPALRAYKGLPLNIDVGAMVSFIPGTNLRLWGGELRWSFIPGNTVLPAIGLRGSYTRLNGVDQLDLDTKGLDVSISKGFLNFTPYGGIGRVWVTSTPRGVPSLSEESFSLNKVFGGVNINFGLVNLALEADRTGNNTTGGVKVGFRF